MFAGDFIDDVKIVIFVNITEYLINDRFTYYNKMISKMQRLTLNHNRLTQVVSTSVISHPSLEHLELKNNLINIVNLQLPKLTSLELRDNAITTTAGKMDIKFKKTWKYLFIPKVKNSIEWKEFQILND